MTGIHWFVFLCVIGSMTIATALDTANLSKASVAVIKDTVNTSIIGERNGEDTNNVSCTSEADDRKWDILFAFEDVYYPSLIALGSATNVLTLLVLMKSPRLYRTPASVYLCALAVSDTLNLLNLFRQRQPPMSVENPFCSVAASLEHIRCPIYKYLDYVPVFLSSWFVLAFTLERFVAVRYPIRSISFCTKRKARIVLGVLCFSSMVFNAPLLFLVNSKPSCESPEQKFPAVTVTSETMSKNTLNCWNIDAMNGTTMSPKSNCETQEVTTLDESMMRLEDSPTEMRRNGDRDHVDNANGSLHDCVPQNTPCMRETKCGFKKEYTDFSLVFSLVDLIFVFLLPSAGIVVLNLFIAATLWKERRRWSRVKPYLRVSTSTFTSSLHERTASILSKRRSLPNRTSLPPLMVLSPLPLLRPMESPASQKEDIGPSPDSSPSGGEVVASLEVVSDTTLSQIETTSSPPDSPSDNLLPASPEGFAYGPLGGHKHQNRVTMGIGVKGAKVTGMLFVVSTAFVALNLPAYVIRIYGLYLQSTVDSESEAVLATKHLAFPHVVAEVFYYTNFGINFFLYCIFGNNFRRSFNTQTCRLFRWLQTFVPCLRSISWPTRDQWSGQGVKTNSCKMDRRHRGESFTSYSRARTLTVTSEMSTRGFGRKGSS
ncbi:uncharacterized protein LOC124160991 [Ischnura elegans]|uniref:uncharacterized protein LOC124160991 n=1 Tax=Ischnura elegans TaxID=197161 RepID=UPI001ED885E1|nr:uncharacterized protein LOC124160991 [Ischnura elegans]